MSEFVGYRANAASPNERKTSQGFVSVYAERKNLDPSLGEYGGDAIPISWATSNGTHEFGIILAADGVGQGAYPHPSLKNYLNALTANVNEADADKAKLSCFLRSLYGSKLFDAENCSALEYAVRCFGDVPTDGFFITPDENGWKDKGNAQFVMPFYERDSQSLGSRILCVYIYLNFRDYMARNNITAWNEDSARSLRDAVNNGVKTELAPRVAKLFDHSDIDSTTKQMRYFLCSTVAVWFYSRDMAAGRVSALSLNCGDARTYVADVTDGVRQISVDDAVADGSMTGFFHFGSAPKTDGGFCDNTLFARIVEVREPCILFACSDGVYDTCPANTATNGKDKFSLPYGDTDDANDFLFEKNMLEALRRSFGIEDFKREVVFNFYAMDSAHGGLEAMPAGHFEHIKRDDSATLAARFFGKKSPLEILDALRATSDTSLDKLWRTVKDFEYKDHKIPYYLPHVQSAEETAKEEKEAYATGEFKDAMTDTVKAEYHALFASMKASGAQTIWNAPHPSDTELSGFGLNKNFAGVMSKYVFFLDLAIADWKYLVEKRRIGKSKNADGFVFVGAPADWKAHEHVIYKKDIFEKLKSIGFDKVVERFTAKSGGSGDKTAEVMLKLYDWFTARFYGKTDKPRAAVWLDTDCTRTPVDSDPTDIVVSLVGADESAPKTPTDSAGAGDKATAGSERRPIGDASRYGADRIRRDDGNGNR